MTEDLEKKLQQAEARRISEQNTERERQNEVDASARVARAERKAAEERKAREIEKKQQEARQQQQQKTINGIAGDGADPVTLGIKLTGNVACETYNIVKMMQNKLNGIEHDQSCQTKEKNINRGK